jgi:hypothetical protein
MEEIVRAGDVNILYTFIANNPGAAQLVTYNENELLNNAIAAKNSSMVRKLLERGDINWELDHLTLQTAVWHGTPSIIEAILAFPGMRQMLTINDYGILEHAWPNANIEYLLEQPEIIQNPKRIFAAITFLKANLAQFDRADPAYAAHEIRINKLQLAHKKLQDPLQTQPEEKGPAIGDSGVNYTRAEGPVAAGLRFSGSSRAEGAAAPASGAHSAKPDEHHHKKGRKPSKS